MPKCYCASCGQANQYSDTKPIFCGYCGASLSLDASSVSPRPSQTVASRRPNRVPIGRRPIINDYDDEEFEFDGTLPDIRKLEVEIELPEAAPRETMGQIWGSGAIGAIRPKGKKQSREEALQNLTKSIFEKKIVDLSPNANE